MRTSLTPRFSCDTINSFTSFQFIENLLNEGSKSPRTIRLAALHLSGLWLMYPETLRFYMDELKLLSLYGSGMLFQFPPINSFMSIFSFPSVIICLSSIIESIPISNWCILNSGIWWRFWSRTLWKPWSKIWGFNASTKSWSWIHRGKFILNYHFRYWHSWFGYLYNKHSYVME